MIETALMQEGSFAMKKYFFHLLTGLIMIVYSGVMLGMSSKEKHKTNNPHEPVNDTKNSMTTLRDTFSFKSFGLSKKGSKDNLDTIKQGQNEEIKTKISKPLHQVSSPPPIKREKKLSTDKLVLEHEDDLDEKKEDKMFDTLRVTNTNTKLEKKKLLALTYKLVDELQILSKDETFQKEHSGIYATYQELSTLLKKQPKVALTEDEEEELKLSTLALQFKQNKERRVTLGASPGTSPQKN